MRGSSENDPVGSRNVQPGRPVTLSLASRHFLIETIPISGILVFDRDGSVTGRRYAQRSPGKAHVDQFEARYEMRLSHPVYTLENQCLMPAGTRVSEESLAELISSGIKGSPPKVPILKFGTIRKDLVNSLRQGPYQVIFDSPKRIADLLSLMARVRLPPYVLEYLTYFKKEDTYTYLHVLKVFALSAILAQTLLRREQELNLETMAGPVHDFGKICVPLSILKKAAPLTRTERGILEHHTLAGHVLLSYYLQDPSSFLARVARDHHERRDGSGYPSGIRLTDRMVEIISVSDVYDALISVRPYRKRSYDNRTALEEIVHMANQGKLGWEVIKALVSFNRRSKPDYRECVVSRERRGRPPEGNLYGVTVDENS